MKWNTAKTFVNQMLVCIFVYVVIAFSAIYNNVVEFHICDFFSFVIVAVFFFGVIIPNLKIIILGMKVLVDFFSKKTKDEHYLFVEEIPVSYSVFAEKFDKDHNRVIPNYYRIIVSRNDIEYNLLSANRLKLTEGKMYNFKVSPLAKMVVSAD